MNEKTAWNDVPTREIVSLDDPAFSGMLDIYQKSFPIEEQTLVSTFVKHLQRRSRGGGERCHLDVIERDATVAAFAFYEVGQAIDGLGTAAYLWYIASDEAVRGSGIGERLYRHVLREVMAAHDCRLLFFEIERYGEVLAKRGPAEAGLAERRKAWYQRLGAAELTGVRYMCSVGWQPAVPMDVFVHLREPLSAEDVLGLRPSVLDDELEIVGPLRFDDGPPAPADGRQSWSAR